MPPKGRSPVTTDIAESAVDAGEDGEVPCGVNGSDEDRADAVVDEVDTDDDTVHAVAAVSRMSPHALALIAGVVMAVILGAFAGWLGYRFHQSQRAADQRAEFVQVARQGAINLTTIDWEHADAEVQRILDSATGTFHDDFAKRSGPFIDVVKQAQSKSQGTVSVAGLESVNGGQAKVLVGVSVETTTADAPQATPRSWRMRIDLQKVGNDVKVSNVEFVP
jgi:Mce-associated membrane protein